MQEAFSSSSSIVHDLSVRIYLCSSLIALRSLFSEEADEFIAEGVKAKQDKKNIRKQLMDQAREIVSNKTLFSHCYSAQRTVANADVVPDALPIERELHEAISQSDRGSKKCDTDYLINRLSGQAIRNAYASKQESPRKTFEETIKASRITDNDSGKRVEEWAQVAHAICNWKILKDKLHLIQHKQGDNDRAKKIFGYVEICLRDIGDMVGHIRKTIESDEVFKNRKISEKVKKVIDDLGHIERTRIPEFTKDINSTERKTRADVHLRPRVRSKLDSLITRIDFVLDQQKQSGWPPMVAAEIINRGYSSPSKIRQRCASSAQDDSVPFADSVDADDDLEARLQFAEKLYLSARESLLDEEVARKTFEEQLNNLFRPYGGKVQFSWQYSQRDSEYADVKEVDPTERDQCVDCIIQYLGADKKQTLIQKGHFRKRLSVPEVFYPLHHLKEALEAYGGADPSIVTQINKFNQQLEKYKKLEAYWKNEGDRELIWRVMSSVTTFLLANGALLTGGKQGSRRDDRLASALAYAKNVYDAFVRAGFYWEAMDSAAVAKNRQPSLPEWSLVICPTAKGISKSFLPQAALRQPVCLKYQDETILGANKWFVVPENILCKHKLLSWLALLDLQKEKIKPIAPEWPGWKIWDDAIVAHDLGEPDRDERNKIAFSLFAASYQEAIANNQYLFKKMATTLHKCLVDLEVSFWPALKEDDSLLPASGALEQSDVVDHSVEVSWKKDSSPRGSIIEIVQFSVHGHKSKVVASLGGEFSTHVLRWMEIFDPLEVQKELRGMAVLDSIKNRVMALPLDPEAEITVGQMQKEIGEWLGTREGTEGLNAALQFARDDPESAQSQFWRKLLSDLQRTVGVRIYPGVVWDTGRINVKWPVAIDPVESIQWVFDSVVPSRHAIDKPVHFSTDPKKAAGVFSLGPPSEDSPIYIADCLREIATEAKLDVAIKISSKIRAASIKEPDSDNFPSPGNLIEFLNWLCADTECGISDELKDQMLRTCRQWANCFGVQVTPVDYSFNAPNIPDEISGDLNVVFAPRSDVGDALIASFGIAGPGGEEIEKAVYAVSAGPAPESYDELVEFIESDDHLRETSLRDLIRRWPSKRLKSVRSLQNAIKGEFFDLFFETMDSLSDDNLRSRAESAFADILKSELSAFLFTPSTISEFEDDWIKPVNKSTEMSGKIKKVLKPGLRDGRGALITPAIVELE